MAMKKMRTPLIIMLFLAMTGVLSGCNKNSAAAQTKAPAVDAVPVEVALASHNAISASYSGTAALVADHEAQVTAKTSGVLKKLYVEEGMTVKAGQLLAELDDADALAKAKQAEAQMHKAEATFAHAQAAMPKHLIPEYEYEQDKFDLAAQRAAYEAANIQLSYTRIVAPVDGVIAQRDIKIGNLVQANQNLFRIVGMNPLQAVLNVPERQLGILKAGQVVQLEADALPGKKFDGTILRIAPVVDPASGTFRVTCQFRDASAVLRPGMFSRIDIVYDQRPDALTVPRSALVEEDGQTSVYVVEKAPPAPAAKVEAGQPAAKAPAAAPDGFIAHRQPVKVGYSDGNKVEIISGLTAGARVITVGRNAVRDGTAILVLDNKA
ncbi:MAG: efflux RND transporter periplasmic adaptor subunit [Proteobacteria bacterium]|nr:efflux RND transporter periplasmic adaptor subunit [Pseudomonadota bacterium]